MGPLFDFMDKSFIVCLCIRNTFYLVLPMLRRQSRKESLMVIGIAAILSLAVFVGVHNSSLLLADISQAPTITFDTTSDLVTYVDENGVHVAATKPFPNGTQMNLLIAFDPTTVTLTADDLSSEYVTSFAPAGEGYATISLEGDFATLQAGDELALLQVAGNPQDVSIADSIVIFADGTSESLVIHVQ